MGHAKLKVKLQLDSGKPISDEKTQELIDAHKNTYKVYWDWVKTVTLDYRSYPLVTNDGWVLFKDNPVIPSVRNFLVQGNSASITRAAVVRCWEMGLKVMCSLHDALYVISDNPDIDADVVEEVMKWATGTILNEKESSIRIDTKIITRDEIWVEEKGQTDWDKLKGYLL